MIRRGWVSNTNGWTRPATDHAISPGGVVGERRAPPETDPGGACQGYRPYRVADLQVQVRLGSAPPDDLDSPKVEGEGNDKKKKRDLAWPVHTAPLGGGASAAELRSLQARARASQVRVRHETMAPTALAVLEPHND
ncbi:hypothetical protein PVAP13_1NG133100 [Panicum virgatum]|uniref:Uncharacterized protein n=1 Tax=Panicum virgatum TaxID=38727 RepID=A0A8T0WLD6_PANVG|nr:hypothetical protein PVAP13_1NG133100 [Panicum virgatum]